MSLENPELFTCDLVLTRGSGWISKAIRWASRVHGEAKTQVNHVGQVVTRGPMREALVAEALARGGVRIRPLGVYAGTGNEVAIFRAVNITFEEKAAITSAALVHAGDKYGKAKILLQLLDSKLLNGAYFFRRIAFREHTPICSYMVAHSFKVVGLDFGVDVRQAQPDDIWDFCVDHPDKYKQIRALRPIA